MRLVIQLSAGMFLMLIALVDLARSLTHSLLQTSQSSFTKLRSVSRKLPRLKRRSHPSPRIVRAARVPTALSRKQKRAGKKKKPLVVFPLPLWVKLRYVLVGAFLSFLFLFLPLLAIIFLQDLPQPTELTTRQIPQTTKIYDRHGTLLYEMYANQNRTLVPLSDVPKSLQQATLAIEDKNFYHHPGFDIASIIRAIKEDSGGKIVQGGSTITQQLIKSSMLTPEQSFTRKIKEVILAFWTERLYSKNQILEMYFNQVPYGGTAWGVEAASETYFNKPVKKLDLAESALLAGLTSAPSVYSPYSASSTNVWKSRQKEVLNRMVSLGYITQKQADKAASEKLTFKPQQTPFYAPHFVNYIKNLLIQKYGLAMVEKGGLSVTTSLDLSLQKDAESIVADEVNHDAYLNLTNGAALVTNPKNGDILAMVGSKDFNDPNGGNVNLTTSLRQPGSTIKVVTYSAALSDGLTAATLIDDSPVSFPQASGVPYTPVNYDGKFHGKVPLRMALANSLNIPAVKTLQQIGIPTMLHLGRDMGITSWNPDVEYGLSLTLGSAEVTMLDMATVNGTLANEGTRVDLNPIIKLTNAKGEVLEQKGRQSGRQILKPGVAYIIDDILADNNARSLEFGPNSPLVIPGHTVSVKTGTTDNKRDNWTIGFTPSYLVAVWVGNNDNSPMSQTLASGITGAAPIWHRIMTELIQDKADEKQPLPSDVVALPCSGRTEYFLKDSVDTSSCRSFLTPSARPQH
jgi:1A family penicillin-binding protein